MKKRTGRMRCILLAFAFVLPTVGMAQSSDVASDSSDVSTLDGILTALYDVISGPAGEARDWDRMRSLFAPEAQLIPTIASPETGFSRLVWSVEDYISQSGPLLVETGFTETELARHIDRYGNIAHVFSTYEGRFTRDGTERVMRGINSIQLLKDNSRWWIVNIFWQQAGPGVEIPEQYLPASEQ